MDEDIFNTQKPKIELISRNKVKFKQPFTDKSKVMNSPFYRGTAPCNKLSPELQETSRCLKMT